MRYTTIVGVTILIIIVQCLLLHFIKWNKRHYVLPGLYFVFMIGFEFLRNGIHLAHDHIVYSPDSTPQFTHYSLYTKLDYKGTFLPLLYTAVIVIVPIIITVIVNIKKRCRVVTENKGENGGV